MKTHFAVVVLVACGSSGESRNTGAAEAPVAPPTVVRDATPAADAWSPRPGREVTTLPSDRDLWTVRLTPAHAYWSVFAEDAGELTVQRVPRAGGAVETVGVHRAPFPMARDALAIVDDAVVLAGVRRGGAALYRIEKGITRAFGAGPRGSVASAGVVAVDRDVYWTAAHPMGPGPLLATNARGATRTVFACDGGDACPELLPGTPAIAFGDETLYALGASPRASAARCPCGTLPSRAVSTWIACMPVDHADCADREEDSWLVRLADGVAARAPSLGESAASAGGWIYHLAGADLVRRRNPDAPDELVARDVTAFAADADGIAWAANARLWTAAH